jgi:hypothetical protein
MNSRGLTRSYRPPVDAHPDSGAAVDVDETSLPKTRTGGLLLSKMERPAAAIEAAWLTRMPLASRLNNGAGNAPSNSDWGYSDSATQACSSVWPRGKS